MGIIRRIAVTATVMLAALAMSGPAAAVPPPPGWPPPSYLRNSEAGLCMDNFALTGEVYQYPCNPQPNQWWWWRKPGGATDNRWLIHIVQGGLDTCLSARGTAYYSEIHLSACREGQLRQQWRWLSWGDQWTIQSVESGKCIGASVGPAVSKLVLAECVIRPSVLWAQVPAW